jgi:membrane protein DedA with SNARE-associated domain
MEFMLHYGYLAIFLGCMLEGEALVILGGFFAYHGLMFFPIVALVAFAGTMVSDIGWFLLGRHSQEHGFNAWRWVQWINRHSVNIVSKRPRFLAFFFRFMYGFRVIIPFSLGRSHLATTTYLAYNALGILLWVAVYAGIGYSFAGTIELLFGRIKHFDVIIGLVIVSICVIFLFGHHVAEKVLTRFNKTD